MGGDPCEGDEEERDRREREGGMTEREGWRGEGVRGGN